MTVCPPSSLLTLGYTGLAPHNPGVPWRTRASSTHLQPGSPSLPARISMLCPPTDNQITGCSQLPSEKQHQGDSSGALAESRHLREDERQERGAGNLLIPPCHTQPFSKQCVELTLVKYPPPCQALKLNLPTGQSRCLVCPCPKRVPQALTLLRGEAEELSYNSEGHFHSMHPPVRSQQVLHSEGLGPSYSQSVLFLQLPPEACAPGNPCSASAPQLAGW